MAEFVNGGMKRSEFCRSCGLALSTLDRHLKKQGEKRRSGLAQISNPTLLIIHRTFTNTDSKIALLGATKSVHYCSVGNPSVPYNLRSRNLREHQIGGLTCALTFIRR